MNSRMSSSTITVGDLSDWLGQFAPTALAEDWDNVGLLVGDRARSVSRIMTCLTPTPESVAEAIERRADLIVAHHPLPFRPIKRITRGDATGGMLLDLIEAHVALYSPHTAFDSALRGINQRIAEGLGLTEIQPIRVTTAATFAGTETDMGSGRWGRLSTPLPVSQWLDQVARFFHVDGLHWVDGGKSEVRCVAVACGAAGEFLADAARLGCDAFVTGELRFHSALEARARSVHVAVPGHHATERFAVEELASELRARFANIEVWASERESDPMLWRAVND